MSNLASAKNNKLDFIQVLRGIAALGVVLCHAQWYLRSNIFNKLAPILTHGALGVDLFFIVSGFIMVYITVNAESNFTYFRKFYIKRIARIWPIYAIMTVLYCLLTQAIPFNHAVQIHLFKSLLFSTRHPILGPGWTLTYEVYFYLVFGTCLLLRNFRWPAFFAFFMLTLGVLPLWWKSKYQDVPDFIFIISSHVIWEFVIGVIIGLIYCSKFRIKNLLPLKLMLVGLSLKFFWSFFHKHPMKPGIIAWGGVLAVLVLILAIINKEKELKAPKIMIGLGNISYSLYLIHLPVQCGMFILFKQKHYSAYGITFLLLTTFVSIILASLSYHYLEKKLCKRVRNFLLNLSLPQWALVKMKKQYDVG